MVVRSLVLAVLVLSGCAVGADEPAPPARIEIFRDAVVAQTEAAPDEVDLCALASQLDSDNVCSLMCDPDAMADFLVAGGMTGGKCVALRCELPGIEPITVGVCLAP